MQNKQHTKLVDGQIQSIRNAIKAINKLRRNHDVELTGRQQKALSHICAYDLDNILLDQ